MAILAGILLILVLLGVSALAALFAIASEAEVLPAPGELQRGDLQRGEPPTVTKERVRTLRLVHR